MNYWEQQKSFWKTPVGRVLHIAILVAILGGGLLALNILVSPYPVIEFFDATPVVINKGDSTNLSWSVIGATEVTIAPNIGRVDLKGSRIVSPSETTIYTLYAVNGSRNRSVEARVMVE